MIALSSLPDIFLTMACETQRYAVIFLRGLIFWRNVLEKKD